MSTPAQQQPHSTCSNERTSTRGRSCCQSSRGCCHSAGCWPATCVHGGQGQALRVYRSATPQGNTHSATPAMHPHTNASRPHPHCPSTHTPHTTTHASTQQPTHNVWSKTRLPIESGMLPVRPLRCSSLCAWWTGPSIACARVSNSHGNADQAQSTVCHNHTCTHSVTT